MNFLNGHQGLLLCNHPRTTGTSTPSTYICSCVIEGKPFMADGTSNGIMGSSRFPTKRWEIMKRKEHSSLQVSPIKLAKTHHFVVSFDRVLPFKVIAKEIVIVRRVRLKKPRARTGRVLSPFFKFFFYLFALNRSNLLSHRGFPLRFSRFNNAT